jgi:hypothetical protein
MMIALRQSGLARRIFKGNTKRTECRVCANGHHTLEDVCP